MFWIIHLGFIAGLCRKRISVIKLYFLKNLIFLVSEFNLYQLKYEAQIMYASSVGFHLLLNCFIFAIIHSNCII